MVTSGDHRERPDASSWGRGTRHPEDPPGGYFDGMMDIEEISSYMDESICAAVKERRIDAATAWVVHASNPLTVQTFVTTPSPAPPNAPPLPLDTLTPLLVGNSTNPPVPTAPTDETLEEYTANHAQAHHVLQESIRRVHHSQYLYGRLR